MNKELPGNFTPPNRAGRGVSGERRVITMLFCDVVDSTGMAEQLDAEEWAEIMNEAFEYLLAPVYRYEGTIARLQGDGFLAFFGAPVAHEDDPVRAVLSGLEIHEELAPFRREIHEDYGLDFSVRVGINTGSVVVGDIGSEQALEYTAMGDAINLAARMEATAAPGTVQVSEHTYRLVAPLFEVEPLGEIDVKGKEEPVASYRVIARKDQPGSLRGIEGLDAPLVGRDEEIAELLNRLDALRTGEGQIVFLIGEAGLGKSRLLREMAQQWCLQPGAERHWTSVQGISYEIGRPYSLFYQHMRNYLGIGAGDTADEVRQKIDRSVADFPAPQKAAVSQVVQTLLAVESRSRGPQLEAEARKRQLFDLTTRVWRNDALDSPSVTVLDDLHWSDPASAELLIHLLSLVEEVPLMILCAMRPDEDSPGWQVKEAAAAGYPEHYHELTLEPLDVQHSNELVDELLVIADLPQDLRRLIQEKAEGNPFFLEEVVRTLIDAGAIARNDDGQRWLLTRPVDTLAIPENLQAMLTSRIDHLEKPTKLTLQMASVIGRTFDQRVLAQVAGKIEQLDGKLLALQQAQLIVESNGQAETAGQSELAGQEEDIAQAGVVYMFRHELTRDVTYRTLLRRQRRRYHRRTGEAIETLFPERLNEEAHRLAYHFSQAGDKARAMKYYEIAGDQAARIYANREAAVYYAKAIDLARDGGDSQLLLRLYSVRGRVLTFDGQFDAAVAGNQELLALAEQMGDRNLALEAIAAQGALFAVPSVVFDAERARDLLEKAQAMAEELGNEPVESKIQWSLMLVNNNLGGTPDVSLAYGQRSLALARKHQLAEQMAYTMNDMARPLTMLGRIEEALDCWEQSRQLFREQNNMPMVVDSMATASSGYFLTGQLELSLQRAQEALALGQKIGSIWGEGYAKLRTAFALAELGYVGQAIRDWQASVKLATDAGVLGMSFFLPAYEALYSILLGASDRGQQLVNRLEERIEQAHRDNDDVGFGGAVNDIISYLKALLMLSRGDAEAARALPLTQIPKSTSNLLDATAYSLLVDIQGRILLATGDFEEAHRSAESMHNTLEERGLAIALPVLGQLQGEALAALGQHDRARLILRGAAEQSRGMQARRQLWPILGILARLAEEDGQDGVASALRTEARQIIELIAGDLDESMRQAFLALPEVREVTG